MSTVVDAKLAPETGKHKAPAVFTWRDHPLFAAVTFTAPLVPGIAAAVTVILFIMGRPGSQALVIGAGTALFIWIGMTWFSRDVASIDHANSNIYNQLCERHDSLKVRLEALKESKATAYKEAMAHNDAVSSALTRTTAQQGPRACLQWITAHGYMDIWNRIHRAEEALIEIETGEAAIGRSHYDQGRLRGSTIPDRDDLLITLVDARKALEQPGKTSQTQGPNEPLSEPAAKAKLRAISHVINKFRDDRWEGLVRARNQLNETGLFTGIVALVLLSIVLITSRVTVTHILAATVFYLVGAIVGLFSRLMADSSRQVAIEDYGLSFARLIQTPLFSGLAAIGGVVLMAMLPIAVEGEVQGLSLPEIFDLGQNRFGLVVAAVFGLTPRLLIDGLNGKAEQYKNDLQKSEAAEKG